MIRRKLALTMAVILTVVSFIVPTAGAKTLFTDVPEDAWSAPYVYELVERGIVSGYGDGTFGPELTVKRSEYAKMLVNITGTTLSASITTPYADVPSNEWYFPYVNSSLNYITGFVADDGWYFRPEWDATREDVTVALIKALGIDLAPYSADPTGFLNERFVDVDSISIHNRIFIAAAVDKGYITGNEDGTFRGQNPIIRAEVVAILCRAFPDNENSELFAVNETLTAFFLDVGQGDSCFIEFPDGKTMLIDSGTSSSKESIVSFIKGRGCSHIDYLIATHPHADHIGAMDEILINFTVGELYMPDATASSKTYDRFMEQIDKRNISVTKVVPNTGIYGIKDVAAVFVAPHSPSNNDLNNSSAVLRLSYGEIDFLFTGDAEYESEQEILNSGAQIEAEILKVGHHGSDTSSSPDFLAEVEPDAAIISCGENNSYGHPKQQTLDALSGVGAQIYRTDIMGMVTVIATPFGFECSY